MKVQTKAHVAVAALRDIHENGNGRPVSLNEIAQRKSVSQSYLEQLFLRMRKADLVKSTRGPGGGYMLARNANAITIADVISAVDAGQDGTEDSIFAEAEAIVMEYFARVPLAA